MKKRRLLEGILAVILSLSMAMPTFAADIPQEPLQAQTAEEDAQ